MRTAVAINGSLIAEGTAIYALNFAAQFEHPLEIFYVQNDRDKLEHIEASLKRIESYAQTHQIDFRVASSAGETIGGLLHLIQEKRIETLFCSTRAQKGILFEDSVADQLARAKSRTCHLAVIKIKKLNALYQCKKVGIFGAHGLPDMTQFAFGLALAQAFQAELILGNSLNITQKHFANLSLKHKKRFLRQADNPFLPMQAVCDLMQIPHHIAHMMYKWNYEDLHDYLLSRKINLMILSVSHLPLLNNKWFKNKIENIFHQSPINCLVLYPGHTKI